jgi:hypothetical protein
MSKAPIQIRRAVGRAMSKAPIQIRCCCHRMQIESRRSAPELSPLCTRALAALHPTGSAEHLVLLP